jgi:hypothetical protein
MPHSSARRECPSNQANGSAPSKSAPRPGAGGMGVVYRARDNVASIFGFEQAGAAHLLVMELVEGETELRRLAPPLD